MQAIPTANEHSTCPLVDLTGNQLGPSEQNHDEDVRTRVAFDKEILMPSVQFGGAEYSP